MTQTRRMEPAPAISAAQTTYTKADLIKSAQAGEFVWEH